jgi:hypothetical protein
VRNRSASHAYRMGSTVAMAGGFGRVRQDFGQRGVWVSSGLLWVWGYASSPSGRVSRTGIFPDPMLDG